MSILELTFTGKQELMEHGSKETLQALINPRQPYHSDPRITCLICIHPYHSPNVEGNVEDPVITACGHIFGNSCLKQWLEPDSALTCPLCRFILKYKDCGHVINPLPAFSKSTPATITADQTPANCSACESMNLPWQRRYDILIREKDVYLYNKQGMTGIEDLKEKYPDTREKWIQNNKLLEDVEKQLLELEPRVEKERKLKEEEFKSRWHL